MTSLEEQLLELNWKCPFSPFIYHITYKVEFWYFKSLCNWDIVSNRTYQNFRDKRLVRPGRKYSNWQRSQPISYKAKFLQRDNVYLVDFKYNITYQNIRGGGNQGQTYFYTIMPKMAKKLQLTSMSFLQNRKVCFNQERLPITYLNFRHKSLVRPKSKSPNWQGSQPISYKTKFSQRDNIYLVDLKYNITYQNIWEKTKVRPIFILWNA